MAAKTRANLKLAFETGDTPDGSDYTNLIDSFISLSDSTAQTMGSDLTVVDLIATEVVAVTVSAVNVNASAASFTTVSAGGAGTFGSMTINGAVSAAGAGTFQGLTVNGALSFAKVETTVQASAGAGAAVPSSAEGFLIVDVSGVSRRIPYFQIG